MLLNPPINKVKLFLKSKKAKGNQYGFHHYGPIEDADIDLYEEALDFTFTNPNVKNIAVTGQYGSGKSSILNTYIKKNKKKVIYVTLANFSNNVSKETLEMKVISQIIEQMEDSEIQPLNGLKIIRKFTKKHIVKTILWIIIVLTSIFCINISTLSEIFMIDLAKYSYLVKWAILINLVLFVWLIFGVIKKIYINKYFTKVLTKINISGFGFDFDSSKNTEDNSVFDRNLSEIVHVLNKGKFVAIIFEDLDRNNKNAIFERLREINIVSNYQSKRKNGPVKFIYLLRDDLLIGEDFTKIFDFSLSISPYSDCHNNLGYLQKEFTKILDGRKLNGTISPKLIRILSIQFPDIRVLKRILNEFYIKLHEHKLDETIEPNKALAIIMYKMALPSDYQKVFRHLDIISYFIDYRNSLIGSADFVIFSEYDKRGQGGSGPHDVAHDKLSLYFTSTDFVEKAIQNITNNTDSDNIIESNGSFYEKSHLLEIIRSEGFILLEILISQGFIEEDYQKYILGNNESTLSKHDCGYYYNVLLNKQQNEFDELDNPENIALLFEDEDWYRYGALNLSLISWAINTNNECYKNILHSIVEHRFYKIVCSMIEFNKDVAIELCVDLIKYNEEQKFINYLVYSDVQFSSDEDEFRETILRFLFEDVDLSILPENDLERLNNIVNDFFPPISIGELNKINIYGKE